MTDLLAAGLAVALGDERWMRDALCTEYPEVEFFVEHGESNAPAKAVCALCLVRDECLDYALDHNIREGIWGGTSGRERKGLGTDRHDRAA